MVKEKAMKYLTNVEVNAIANGMAFRPVYGNGEKSECQFVRIDGEDKAYYAVFNYTEEEQKTTTPLSDLGLDTSSPYEAKELWTGNLMTLKGEIQVTLPPSDVAVFSITRRK